MAPKNNKRVNFAGHFKPPSSEEILQAIRTNHAKNNVEPLKSNEKLYEKLLKHFAPLAKPTDPMDWLALYRERGQTVTQYLRTAPISAKKTIGKKCFIYLVMLGDFKETKLDCEELFAYTKIFFGTSAVKLLEVKVDIRLEETKLNRGYGYNLTAYYADKKKRLRTRFNAASDRLQVLAQSLHNLLFDIKPIDACCLMGFTEYDLYSEESDLFVAGLSDGEKRVGVFSCFRYDPRIEFCEEKWHKISKIKTEKSDDDKLMLMRSCKLLVHEVAHLLGIEHCIYMDCCMNGSGHLQEDFRQTMFICPVDLKKLTLALKIDIAQMYANLKLFFDKHSSKENSQWIEKIQEELF
jgi:archaemetzincin